MNPSTTSTLTLSRDALKRTHDCLDDSAAETTGDLGFENIQDQIIDATAELPADAELGTLTLKDSEWLLVYGAITATEAETDYRQREDQNVLDELKDGFPPSLRTLTEQVDHAANALNQFEGEF